MKEFKENLEPLEKPIFKVICENYENRVARLNISTLHWKWQCIDVVFLINVLKKNK